MGEGAARKETTMTGLTWRPVREDDRLDPGDRVRITVPVDAVVGQYNHEVTWHPYTTFFVMSDGPAGVLLRRHPLDLRNEWILVQRMDLEVPR